MSGKKSAKPQHKPSGESKVAHNKALDDELDQALEDSFPASDPPQMTQPDVKVGAPERAKAGRK